MSGKTEPPGRTQPYLVRYSGEIFGSYDFIVGVVLGVFVAVVAFAVPTVLENSAAVFAGSTAIGVALVAVILQAQSNLSTHIDGHYREIIDRSGGWEHVTMPYLVAAYVGGITALGSLLAVVLRPALPAWLHALALGAAVLGLAWSILGAVQAVSHTNFHGRQRSAIEAASNEVRKVVRERRRDAG